MSRRVLFIDDEEDVRLLVQMTLEPYGWRVDVARANEGLEMCLDEPPDVLIVDYQMPEMTGTDLARTVRSHGFGGPVVLYSACLSQAVEDEALELGIHTVEKPAVASLVAILRAYA